MSSGGVLPARKFLRRRPAPLVEVAGRHLRPSGLDGVVEHVAVGEVLHQEAVRVAPVVEDLASLDVPPDAPRVVVAVLPQVLVARGQRIQVGDLVGGVHVAATRAQHHRERVVVGRGGAPVAADERHRRAAVALARKVQEVADDQAEVVQVPVQGPLEGRRLQHHVPQPLDPRRLPGRPLRRVRPVHLPAGVEHQRPLPRQLRQFLDTGDHPQRNPGRIPQVHADAAAGAAQLTHRRVVRRRQLVHVGAVGGLERRCHEPRLRALADHHAVRAHPGAAEIQGIGRARGRVEAEGVCEPLGRVEVRLLELHPRQVLDLDHRVLRPAGAVTPLGPLLAV